MAGPGDPEGSAPGVVISVNGRDEAFLVHLAEVLIDVGKHLFRFFLASRTGTKEGASHGHHHVLRHVGSIGQRFPQHTLKGMRMAGRMGGERVTTRGLKVVFIDKDSNILAVRGAVPGRKGTMLEIVSI